MFLETLMFHFQNQKKLSLLDLCRDIQIIYGVSVRKQSLDERFSQNAVSFLKTVIEKSLKELVIPTEQVFLFKKFKRVKVKDSTSFVLPSTMRDKYAGNGGGSSDAGMSIQFEYELKTNNITELGLYSKKVNDYQNARNTLSNIEEGDLVIRDLGYISIDLLKSIDKANAFYLNRIKPQTLIFDKVKGNYNRISIHGIIRKLKKSQKSYLVKDLYIGDKKFLPCRVIFYPVPDDKIKERRKRQLAKSNRRGSSVDTKVLESLEVNVFITNTTEDQIPAKDVYNAYRLRWQIELVFKSWKQNCEINALKNVKSTRVETIIYAQLLWIIMNWHIINTYSQYFITRKVKELCLHKCFKTMIFLKHAFQKALKCKKPNMHNLMILIEKTLAENHFKEKRKGRISSIELMTLLSN
jgi:hypothetical protein